ncbi:MAG: rhodanese-like domain-containing protein [Bdellovibrionales bacterium]|nr:rhodanese-like domain-containing protein [Bdellovibrionales bacterium]
MRFKILVCLFTLFFIVSSAFANDSDYISPDEVTGAKTVNAVEAKQLFEQGAYFIDVRKNSDWEAGRIPGALHIIYDDKISENTTLTDESLKQEGIKHEDSIVFYCNGIHCARSSLASSEAVKWGYSSVHYFRLGYPEWKEKGYPFE